MNVKIKSKDLQPAIGDLKFAEHVIELLDHYECAEGKTFGGEPVILATTNPLLARHMRAELYRWGEYTAVYWILAHQIFPSSPLSSSARTLRAWVGTWVEFLPAVPFWG